MMKNVKIIANYLPQFYEIPENNKWWGAGFTDWVTVKNAKPLYKYHCQPKVPAHDYYYNLTDKNTLLWQAKLAKKYSIYGFGIYHYWFSSNQQLLEKPAEIILANKDIDINFMFIWDNSSWKRTWSNAKFGNVWAPKYENNMINSDKSNGMLAELVYGTEEDWKKHFIYLLPFFKDDRYIKIDGKPVFVFYNQNNNPKLIENMCKYWNQLAIKNGLSGISFIGKKNNQGISIFEHEFLYEPLWNGWTTRNKIQELLNSANIKLHKFTRKPFKYNYDEIWKSIIYHAENCSDARILYGGFVGYDDTPRRGNSGKIVQGSTPEKFGYYIKKLLEISQKQNKEMIFITAWNEWGEGSYLEPDEMNGEEYLKAINEAVNEIEK